MGDEQSKMSKGSNKNNESSNKKQPKRAKTEADEETKNPESRVPSKIASGKGHKNICLDHNENIKYLCKVSACYKLMCEQCYQEHKSLHNKKKELSESILNKYHIIKCMGKGGFGLVFAAEAKLQRFALKVLNVFQDVDASMNSQKKKEYIDEMRKETMIHQELRHDYIVSYYNDFYIENEEKLVIEMELCDSSLAAVIETISSDQALIWFAQICSAVSYLHEPDERRRKPEILHRDLKPGNILIKEKKVKVCDFGGAKYLNQTRMSLSKVNPEQFFGTQEYLAPEIFTQDVKRFTKATDIWALGIIFFKMITRGKHPLLYECNDPKIPKIDKMRNQMEKFSQNTAEVKNLLTQLPMSDILIRCLEFDPRRRIEIGPLIELVQTELDNANLDVSTILNPSNPGSESNSNSKSKSNNRQKAPTINENDFRSTRPEPKKNKDDEESSNKNKIRFPSEVSNSSEKNSSSGNSETFNTKANDLFKNQEYKKALELYTKASEMNPSVAKYYSNISACLTKLGKYDEALKNANKCLDLDPQFIRGYAKKGKIYFEKKEFVKAWAVFQEGLKIDASHAECLEGIETILQRCSPEEKSKVVDYLKQNAEEWALNANWLRSMEYINQAIQVSPKKGELYLIKAKFFLKMKKYDDTITEAKKAYDLSPFDCKDALQIVADSYLILNRTEDALVWYNKIVQNDPNNQKAQAKIKQLKGGMIDNLFEKSESFRSSKNFDLALEYINQALNLSPREIKYLAKKAQILDEKGDKKGALQTLAFILEIDKSNADAFFMIGKIFLEMKQIVLAQQSFQEGVNANPLHQGLRMATSAVDALIQKAVELNREGVMLYQLNHFSLAIPKFNAAIDINPTVAIYYYNKAGAQIKSNDYIGAFQTNQKFLELDKTSADGFAQKGLIHLGLNQRPQAKASFEEGLRYEPNHEECRNGLRSISGNRNVDMDDLAKLLLLGALLGNERPQPKPQPQMFFMNRPGGLNSLFDN